MDKAQLHLGRGRVRDLAGRRRRDDRDGLVHSIARAPGRQGTGPLKRPRGLESCPNPMSASDALPRLTIRQSFALVWRTLRSMRTALILLLMLALASVAGSLIPQEPNTPDRVAQFQVAHPLVSQIYSAFGFFNVFGSWWFTLITFLLFTSLIACLLPRTRAVIRAMRQKPVQ